MAVKWLYNYMYFWAHQPTFKLFLFISYTILENNTSLTLPVW